MNLPILLTLSISDTISPTKSIYNLLDFFHLKVQKKIAIATRQLPFPYKVALAIASCWF